MRFCRFFWSPSMRAFASSVHLVQQLFAALLFAEDLRLILLRVGFVALQVA